MARTVKDAKLETPTARARLATRHDPYWKAIDGGMHIGYRKGRRRATWVARYFGDDGRYRKSVLGIADDVQDADVDPSASPVLTFSQAQEEARAWFRRQRHQERGIETEGPYTVEKAMETYLAEFGENRSHYATARGHIEAFILPELGKIEAADLTAAQIRAFHRQVADAPARIRTRPGNPQKYKAPPVTPDAHRKRQATANKILTTLKAALNKAYGDNKIPSDAAWRKVKPFKGVDAAHIRYLKDDEVTRLVNACEPDFRLLVQAAVLTGARYGELGRVIVADFNSDAGTLFIAASKSDKARHAVLSDEGRQFFSRLSAGRTSDALLFRKADGEPWGMSHQRRRMLSACQAAKIQPAISFHILRHTHASRLAMRGVPMGVIAHQLGHTDTRMAEKHYAHLSPSYVADTIRQNFPALGIVKQDNVTPLQSQK